MKKLWDNSSKLYKAIAIVLTLIMVVTPLYIHFEKRYDAKAAYSGNITVSKKFLPTGGTIPGDFQDVTGTADVNADGEYYYYIKFDDTSWEKISYVSSHNGEGVLQNDENVDYTYFGIPVKSVETFSEIKVDDAPISVTWDYFSWNELAVTATVNGNASSSTFGGDLRCGDGASIVIEAESAYDIKSLTVFGESITIDTSIKTYENNIYKINYTYKFSEHSSVVANTPFTNKSIVVEDENSDSAKKTKTLSCDSIIYDLTKPIITENVSSGDEYNGKTYTNYNYKFKISSGTGTDESELAEAYYEISGAATGNGRKDITISSGDNTITGDFGVPASETESGTTIKFYAKDKAGNTKEDTVIVKIDGTKPDAPVIKYLRDGNEISKKNDNKYYLKPDDIIEITASDNFKLQKIDVFAGTHYTERLDGKGDINSTSGKYSKPVYEMYGKSSADQLAEGTYLIGARAYDYAIINGDNFNYNSTESNFTIDGTDPVIDAVELWCLKKGAGAFEKVTNDDLNSDNVFFYNPEKYNGLEYRVKITESNYAPNTDIYLKSNHITDGATGFTKDGDYYKKNIPVENTTYQPVGEAVAYTIYTVDYAGNEAEESNIPKICVVDTDIRFSDLSLKDSAGNAIATDEDSLKNLSNKYLNKVYTLSVKVTSGYDISKISLKYDDDDTNTKILTEGTGFTDSTEDYTNLHYAEVEFKIPAEELGELVNKKFSGMQLYAEDSDGRTKSVGIPLLMYDSTKPIVSSTADGSTKITVDNEWHKSYSLAASILSGTNVTESELKSAGYNYTGTDNGTDKAYTVSGTSITDTIDIPESNNINGTTIEFQAEDMAGNKMEYSSDKPNSFTIKVDATNPTINSLTAGGSEANSTPLAGNPSIGLNVKDNLTVDNAKITVTLPDGTNKTYNCTDISGEEKDISFAKNYTLSTLIGKSPSDGSYKVRLEVEDKAGNPASKEISFDVDNTAPEFLAEIISGTSGKNNGYYNSNVVVRLTVKDNNFDASKITVTDNGSEVSPSWSLYGGDYVANVTFNSEGRHDVVIRGTDKSGTAGASKQVDFIIDKKAPSVSLLLNGGISYNESMGALNLTSAANINVSVSDSNEDSGDLRVQVVKTVPDTATTTTEFLPTSNRSLSFSDEADYVINIYAVDKANNQSSTRTISFRIDTTAPTLTISGVNGGTSSSATSVGFNITESFWQDASGTVTIYRKAGDGQEEALYKTLTLTPTQRAYTLSELLSDTGVYRFEFEARDRVGHTANTTQTITVDRNKPEIRLSGVNNYDVTDGIVSISATISDEFFLSKTVSATGTVTNADGTKNPISFSNYMASANPTLIEKTFSEDGIYDIVISSQDVAGNESISSVHFTIDTTAPVIGDLSKWDGKTVNSIDLDIDLDELVSDLTVCEVHMYLNGSEYDDVSDLEDGAYTLLITAEDELGHVSEKSASFVLDTKGPVFIVTGVEDGEVKDENYDIEISLQLDEDKLTKVTLNDNSVLLSNNNTTATLKVTDRGVYELYMEAEDPAGNREDNTISFIYGDESMAVSSETATNTSGRWWLWIIAAVAVLGCGGFIFIVLKRRKNE